MEIIVVGAGIIGQTTARRLSMAGHSVRVVAPRSEPHMASTGNAGTIASYAVDPVGTPDVLRDIPRLLFDRSSPLAIHRASALRLAPWLLRFLRQSLPVAASTNREALADLLKTAKAEWLELAQEVGGAGLFRDKGAIYAFDTEAQVAAAKAMISRRRATQISIDTLSASQLQSLEPGLPSDRFAGGALFPATLWMTDPASMLSKISAQVVAEHIDASVTALQPKGAGWSVTLDTGKTLTAQAVVIAAGAWSGRLLRPLGLRIPLTAERGYHLEFDMPLDAQPVTRPVCSPNLGFYFTPMDGRLRAAGTVELGGIGAPPSPHRWTRLEEGVRSVFPDLPPPSRRWMGLRPSIPDSLPVIGPARPGLITAFGHGHIGLTLAPLTAEHVENALHGRAVPASSHPNRFA